MTSRHDAVARRPLAAPMRTTGGSSFGNAVLAAFVLAQALDAALTYVGIATFGASVEANPLVAWYVSAFGAGVGLAAVKTLAIGCAGALYMTARHRILGGLTVLYLAGAVLPWTRLLLH